MQIPKELLKYNLERITVAKRRRLVLTGEADTGSGKTRLIFATAPRPLLYVNLDQNSEGLEDEYRDDNILVCNVKMPADIDQAMDKKEFKRVQNLAVESISKNLFRTVAIDTGDALWELCRRGYIGGLDFGDGEQKDFTPANGSMRKIFRAAKANKECNLIVMHRTTAERKDSVSRSGKKISVETGRKVMAGWKWTKYESQCHVRLEKIPADEWQCDNDRCQDRKKGCVRPEVHRLNRFSCTIVKSTVNERIEGEVLRGVEIDFKELGQMVYPLTRENPEVWD